MTPFWSKLQALGRCESGSNAIEFAAVFPIFVVIILATLQIAIVFVAQAYLESATEEGARYVLTNQANGLTPTQFKTMICANITALFTCNNVIVALQQAPTTASLISASLPQFDNNGNLVNPTTYSIVPAPAKMMLVVMYQWPVYGGPLGLSLANLGNGKRLLVSTQVFQIEPYSGG